MWPLNGNQVDLNIEIYLLLKVEIHFTSVADTVHIQSQL